jgi:hypothetical protein
LRSEQQLINRGDFKDTNFIFWPAQNRSRSVPVRHDLESPEAGVAYSVSGKPGEAQTRGRALKTRWSYVWRKIVMMIPVLIIAILIV